MNHDHRHHRDHHERVVIDECSTDYDSDDETPFVIRQHPNHHALVPHTRHHPPIRHRRYSSPDRPDFSGLASPAYVYGSSMTPNLPQVNICNHNDDLHCRRSPLLARYDQLTAGARSSVSDRMSHSDRLSQNISFGCDPRWQFPLGFSWLESRAVNEYKAEQRECENKQKLAVEQALFKYQESEAKKKAELKAAKEAWEVEKAKEEEDLKAKEKAWELKMVQKEQDEKAKKKAWEAEQLDKKQQADEKERVDLLLAGLPPRVVDAIVKPKSAPIFCPELTYSKCIGDEYEPGFVRVHIDRICVDALRHYNIPWRYDERDKDYLIIRRDPGIDLEILVEHTRRLRSREHWPFTRRDEDGLCRLRKHHPRHRWW